ncbi:MAG: beta-CASP ribonuclease aCPSF1, partial [Thermoplasmata archaeon]|nr:beta-CASP ribonuclease aCPSF1 [Thermoplasmata archaeon]
HAHLDHSGLVPALFMYGYDGPIYCTAPTRDLMSLLQVDSLKVFNAEGIKPLYRSEDIRGSIKHCITLDYGETVDVSPDIKLTLHNAGHILGSAIAHFHIGDGLYNIAITGDTKYEKTWLFDPAQTNFPRLEAALVEATYGGGNDIQPSRDGARENLKEIINTTIDRKGHILIPVFAVGRSQEVMLVLERLVRQNEIPEVPVYLDGMIWEATAIHTAYPEFLNRDLREAILKRNRNPFLSPIFKRVDSNEMREGIINDPASCIVLATSGMMNGGPVMEYFKNWADDPKNSMSFVGYQAEGTLGRRIQRGADEISLMERDKHLNIKIRMDVETTEGFSGHSDRKQLMRFVSNLNPRPSRILMFHGDEKKCIELGNAINRQLKIEVNVLHNLEGIRYR